MDYLKIVKNDVLKPSSNAVTCETFDSKGYMARFRVAAGTLHLYCGKNGKYTLETGQSIDFVGKITYYGVAEVQYILFDKI